MQNLNSLNNNFFIFFLSKLIIISFFFSVNSAEQNIYNIAIIPFKSYLPTDFSLKKEVEQLISSWVYRRIYLNIEVESGQKIPMFLNFEQPIIHTSEIIAYFRDDEDNRKEQYTKNCEQICNFNYENSNSYTKLSDFNISFYNWLACAASEKMVFYKDLETKQKSIYEFKFLHTSNHTHVCFLSGIVDTNSPSDQNYSFFYQIKNLINSRKFSWSFYFSGTNEGKFIIGDIIDNKNLKFYNDNEMKNYISINNNQTSFSERIFWKLIAEKIYIGDYSKDSKSVERFDIVIHNRYISVDHELFEEVKKHYLLEQGIEQKICSEVITDYYYHSIYCSKNNYLSLIGKYEKLPNFIIFLKQPRENISFSAKDLFLEQGNNIYFFIREDKKSSYFTIGTILFEKYITVFDDDAKYLYILRKKTSSETAKDYTTLKIVLIAVFSFILCAIIFIVIGKFYGKKIFSLRKKKANELDDDYFDYTPKTVNDEKNTDPKLLDENEENGGNNGAK